MPDKDSKVQQQQQQQAKERKAAAASDRDDDDGSGQPADDISDPSDNWNISLMLDTYDDIFSYFDARHYSERAISHDFLAECRRASIEKVEKGLEIRMMMPEKLRDPISEGLIQARLRKHFKKHLKELQEEVAGIKRKGFAWAALGAGCMLLSGIIRSIPFSILDLPGHLLNNMLLVAFEPAGWFLMWTGLDTIIVDSREHADDLAFYAKMAGADFKFLSC